MSAEKRDHSIDILKGIAIILVLIGHIPYTPDILRAWLYTFHVPTFFVCSGILFSVDRYPKFKDFFISRVKGLLLPILTLGILSALLQLALCWAFNTFSHGIFSYTTDIHPVSLILSLLIGYRLHEYYFTLWFLYTLFLGELIFYYLAKLIRKRWYGYLIILLCGIALQYVISSHVYGFVWSIDLLPACLAFLSCGALLKMLIYEKGKKAPVWILPIAIVLSFVFTYLNMPDGNQVNLFYGRMWNPFFYLISALSGIMICVIISGLIGRSRTLEFYGRNSLVTYAFHSPLAIVLMMGLLELLAAFDPVFDDLTFRWIITVTGALLFLALLDWLISRFAPWLIGKKKGGRAK